MTTAELEALFYVAAEDLLVAIENVKAWITELEGDS